MAKIIEVIDANEHRPPNSDRAHCDENDVDDFTDAERVRDDPTPSVRTR